MHKESRETAPSSGKKPFPVLAAETHLIHRFLEKLRPAKSIPWWVRYSATVGIVLLFFFCRYSMQGMMLYYPYLLFLPAIVIPALLFDRLSGCLAVLLSGLLAFYFFIEPYHSFTGKNTGAFVALGMYFAISTFIALVLEALRETVDALGKAVSDQALLAAIVRFSDDAIVSKTVKGEILSWNVGAERIFGYTAEEAIGKNIRMIIPPEKAGEENEILDKIRNGTPVEHFETVRTRKDGQHIDVSVTISPLYDREGHIIGASKIARDITPQKEAAAERDHYMRELEEANKKLNESNKQLDDFTHIVSHDLKEPVRGIDAYCSFLLEDYKDKLDSSGQGKLDQIQNMCRRINELISDLLKYSRVGREGSGLEDVNLEEVINSILDLMKPQTEKEAVEITVASPLPKVYCSKAHIAEIFRNLIINGIKYNVSHPKKIEIGFIKGHSRHPKGHVFFVKDNGIGIPPETRETVFNMFKRLHGRGQYGGGTGAGLAIVKKLVEQHDGEVWIESNEGGGSIFYFYVSCA